MKPEDILLNGLLLIKVSNPRKYHVYINKNMGKSPKDVHDIRDFWSFKNVKNKK